ncbi:MAG: T9SS type A sorting domain-containing protein [Ignavibacteriae bacterium]|nr:T9SS type A sorting domain-containing protein [Ignavibacteriota bacterium]
MKLKLYYYIFIFLCSSLYAEQDFQLINDIKVKDKFNSLLGTSNEGKEFWLTFNPVLESSGFGNGHKVYIYSQYDTKVILEVPGKGYTQQLFLNPNEVKEFSLPASIGQCYRKTANQRPSDEVYYPGNGIHVYSDKPIMVYALTVYNQGSDGYLAMPATAYGKNYVVSTWNDVSDNTNLYYPNYVAVIAPYDFTNVTFTLGGNPATKTSTGLIPGGELKKSMFKGDVFLISSFGTKSDLSGSRISATKPVVVVSSNYYSNLTQNSIFSSDLIMDVELPVFTWDYQYLITPVFNRTHLPVLRVYAKEPNTIVYRDGFPVDTLTMNTYMEKDAYITINDNISQNFPIVISGDKPIYVKQYNRSQDDDGVPGDAFMFSVIPFSQQLKEYTFITAGVTNTASFDNYYLNIAYVPNDSGLIPIDFEIGLVNGDSVNWQTLRNYDPSPGVQFSIPVNDKYYFSKTIGINGEGTYKIRAKQDFPAYIYGTSPNLSYGYPAGQNYIDLEKNDTNSPVPQWKIECNGSVKDASVEEMPRTNPSKLLEVMIDTLQTFNYEITIDNFIPGENNRIKWNAFVIDETKDANAVITFSDRSGNDTTINFSYHPGLIQISPNLDLGEVPVGITVDKDFWVVNKSSRDEFKITKSMLMNIDNEYELLPANLPVIIPPMDSAKFTLRFTSKNCGKSQNVVEIGDSCFIASNRSVTAVSYGLTARPDLDFGNIPIGIFSEKNIYIYNETIDNANLDSLSLKFGDKGFSIDNRDNRNVNPLDSIKAIIRFSPTETGTFIDSIGIADSCGYHLRLECKANAFKVSVQPNLLFDKMYPGNEEEKEVWVVNESDKYTYILDTLVFKNNNQGFEIRGISFPDTITPTDAAHFYVVFIAREPGIFMDSIGISESNLMYFNSEVKADVISSVDELQMTEYCFDDICIESINPNPSDGNCVDVILTKNIAGSFQLNIYNEIGFSVVHSIYELKQQGRYLLKLNISSLQSGIYFIECQAGNISTREKLLISK